LSIATKLLLGILTSFTLFSILISLPVNPVADSSFRAHSTEDLSPTTPRLPQIFDINLKANIVFHGLDFPTSFAFLGPDDILVLEKNSGHVRRIVNGSLLPESLLSANVSKEAERGMLGIATTRISNGSIFAFLYFTESSTGGNNSGNLTTIDVPRNRLYRYDWHNNTLSNPRLLVDLPATPGPSHNGGRITIGPDNNVYFTVGDMNFPPRERFFTRAENVKNGGDPDGRAGILRVAQDGQPLQNDSLIGDKYPLSLYYAYGIRNSFGLDFDPVTGNLWDTENGLQSDDEINLVKPGFNSGWNKVQGILEIESGPNGPIMTDTQEGNTLVHFDGQGKYSDPEFTWSHSVGPTALKFLDSKIYGNKYENDMFVGDFHNGNVYHFDLTENRTALELDGILKDKVANSQDELKSTVFGGGFGAITDIEVGPDGYLYFLSVYQGGYDCRHREDIILNMSSQVRSDKVPCIFYNSQLPGTIFRVMPEIV
jgi:glucose/arabinose dehydrogenase